MRISDWSEYVVSSDLVHCASSPSVRGRTCNACLETKRNERERRTVDGRFVVDDQDALVHGVPRLPFRWFSGAASRLRFYDRCVTASATVEIRVADALAAQFQHDRRDRGDARLDAGAGVVVQVAALFPVVELAQEIGRASWRDRG